MKSKTGKQGGKSGGRILKRGVPAPKIDDLITTIRGEKVILDSNLAAVYGVQTKVLNQAIKRNPLRFPSDFCFQLTEGETEVVQRLRSQVVTLKRGQNMKYRPHAFTEHGALMAANVLNSDRATEIRRKPTQPGANPRLS